MKAIPQNSNTPSRGKKRRRRRMANRGAPVESSASPASLNTAQPDKKRKFSQSKRSRRQGPSEEALALSTKLKEYSSQKRLSEALELFWHPSSDSIRDGHHACIVIDCSARCGSIKDGEKVMDEMIKSGMEVNVQAKTALLKGYAHSGMLQEGSHLFADMCSEKDIRNRPNVRTLNTLLRGCLWTATTETLGELFGGLVSSEAAWQLFRRHVSIEDLDISSYEYYIAQLCYALRVDDAKSVIDEMKRKYNLTGSTLNDAEPSVVESLSVSLVALARALTLLKWYDEASVVTRNALNAADTAKGIFEDSKPESSHQHANYTGGKRGWKDESSSAPRRAVSNSLFRSHRLSEVQSEASDLLAICSLSPVQEQQNDLAFFLVSRLLYFSGGGTTDLSLRKNEYDGSIKDTSTVRCQLLNSLWHSFGLKSALLQAYPEWKWLCRVNVVGENDIKRVLEAVEWNGGPLISDDGFIDFREVFRERSDKSSASLDKIEARPLDIELGSGFGDWIVRQAIANPERNHVAVEMRADRVAQTFSKAVLNGSRSPLQNLCCVGSECGSFLRQRIFPGTVSSIFVNHPEPPTQTYGASNHILTEIAQGGEEPAHMLNSSTLVAASRCLKTGGKLIIVTDNRWYARLICVTLLKAMKVSKDLISSSELGERSDFRQVETFGDSRERVVLFEGQPSGAIGHSVRNDSKNGSSYFDRLWRSGAGTHAERRKRFIIIMVRMQDAHDTSSHMKPNEDQHCARSRKSGKSGKKSRKRSEAKQKRRNERRLAKRKGDAENVAMPS